MARETQEGFPKPCRVPTPDNSTSPQLKQLDSIEHGRELVAVMREVDWP